MSDGVASMNANMFLYGPAGPTATITEPTSVQPGMMCAWTAGSNSPDAPYTYRWTVGKQLVRTDPVLYYASESPFTINLTVTDAAQRQMSTALSVEVSPSAPPTCDAM